MSPLSVKKHVISQQTNSQLLVKPYPDPLDGFVFGGLLHAGLRLVIIIIFLTYKAQEVYNTSCVNRLALPLAFFTVIMIH